MTDARWAEVQDDIGAATRHFALAVRLYDAGGFGSHPDDLDAYRASMALQHAMQSAHTSLEGGLKRILEIIGEDVPSGARSHVDLIKRVAKPMTLPGHRRMAIFTPDVEADVHESRRFRHRAMHDYDNFEPTLATPSIEAARRLATTLAPCIEAFRRQIDPPEPSKGRASAP